MSHRGQQTREQSRGRRGEAIAGRYLQRRGWNLVVRNLQASGGEIDLLATRRGVLLAVEVKVRSRGRDDPGEVLTSAQRERIVRVLARTRTRYDPNAYPETRVDLLIVDLDRWPARVRRVVNVATEEVDPRLWRRDRSR